MKKCKWSRDNGWECHKTGTISNGGRNYFCPKGANKWCEIIPPKKPRMVRVKSWGWIGQATGRILTDTEKLPNRFPCTILINRKYLGDKHRG